MNMNEYFSVGPRVVEGKTYTAEVTGQALDRSADGDPQLVLALAIEAAPDDGSPAPARPSPRLAGELVIVIPDDELRLRRAVSDLQALATEGVEIERLLPGHPDAVSLVGRQLRVTPRRVNDGVEWDLAAAAASTHRGRPKIGRGQTGPPAAPIGEAVSTDPGTADPEVSRRRRPRRASGTSPAPDRTPDVGDPAAEQATPTG